MGTHYTRGHYIGVPEQWRLLIITDLFVTNTVICVWLRWLGFFWCVITVWFCVTLIPAFLICARRIFILWSFLIYSARFFSFSFSILVFILRLSVFFCTLIFMLRLRVFSSSSFNFTLRLMVFFFCSIVYKLRLCIIFFLVYWMVLINVFTSCFKIKIFALGLASYAYFLWGFKQTPFWQIVCSTGKPFLLTDWPVTDQGYH